MNMELPKIMNRPVSAYALFVVGLILVIEPLLPQYHFSIFWFSLGVIAMIISIRDLIYKT